MILRTPDPPELFMLCCQYWQPALMGAIFALVSYLYLSRYAFDERLDAPNPPRGYCATLLPPPARSDRPYPLITEGKVSNFPYHVTIVPTLNATPQRYHVEDTTFESHYYLIAFQALFTLCFPSLGYYFMIITIAYAALRTYSVSWPTGKYGAEIDVSKFVGTPLAAAVLAPLARRTLGLLESRARQPWAVPEGLAKQLEANGIDAPTDGSSHDHPAHFYLRQHFIKLASTYLIGPYTILSSKLSELRTTSPALVRNNPVITAKDIARFGNSGAHVPVSPILTPYAFLDEVLQWLTPADIARLFEYSPALDTLVCSLNMPHAVLRRLDSPHPALYNLRYHRDDFIYTPEGDAGGQYTTPIAGAEWLRIGGISRRGAPPLRVSLVASKFAHHLVVITRLAVEVEHVRTFEHGANTVIPRRIQPFTPLVDRIVPISGWSRMYSFAERYPLLRKEDYSTKLTSLATLDGEKTPLYLRNRVVEGSFASAGHWRGTGFAHFLRRLPTLYYYAGRWIPGNTLDKHGERHGEALTFVEDPITVDARTYQLSRYLTGVLPPDLSPGFLPADLTITALVAHWVHSVFYWAIPKVILVEMIVRVRRLLFPDVIDQFLPSLWRALDLQAERCVLFVFLWILWGAGVFTIPYNSRLAFFTAPRVVLVYLLPGVDFDLVRITSVLIGSHQQQWFGLPGYSVLHQVMVVWIAVHSVLPGLPFFHHNSPTDLYWAAHAAVAHIRHPLEVHHDSYWLYRFAQIIIAGQITTLLLLGGQYLAFDYVLPRWFGALDLELAVIPEQREVDDSIMILDEHLRTLAVSSITWFFHRLGLALRPVGRVWAALFRNLPTDLIMWVTAGFQAVRDGSLDTLIAVQLRCAHYGRRIPPVRTILTMLGVYLVGLPVSCIFAVGYLYYHIRNTWKAYVVMVGFALVAPIYLPALGVYAHVLVFIAGIRMLTSTLNYGWQQLMRTVLACGMLLAQVALCIVIVVELGVQPLLPYLTIVLFATTSGIRCVFTLILTYSFSLTTHLGRGLMLVLTTLFYSPCFRIIEAPPSFVPIPPRPPVEPPTITPAPVRVPRPEQPDLLAQRYLPPVAPEAVLESIRLDNAGVAMRDRTITAGHPHHPLHRYHTNVIWTNGAALADVVDNLPLPDAMLVNPAYNCFWVALGHALHCHPDKLMCMYLASLNWADVRPYHLWGLVSRQDVRDVAARLQIGISYGVDVRAHIEIAAPAEGMPTVVLHAVVRAGLGHFLGPTENPPPGDNVGGAEIRDLLPYYGLRCAKLTAEAVLGLLVQWPPAFGFEYPLLAGREVVTGTTAHYAGLTGANLDMLTVADPPALPRAELRPDICHFIPDHARADMLSQDLRDHPSVWQNAEILGLGPYQRAMTKLKNAAKVNIVAYHGVPGCGKTYAVEEYLRTLPADELDQTFWHSPTQLTLSDALHEHNPVLSPSNFMAGAEIYRKVFAKRLIIDDYTKLWPGTLDWIHYNYPVLEMIILTGDPAQGTMAFPSGQAITRSITGDHLRVLEACQHKYYGTINRRCSVNVCRALGYHYTDKNPTDGNIIFVSKPPGGVPFTSVSPRFVETKTGGGTQAFTHTDTQGLTFDGDYCFDMGGMSNTISDNIALVGLTRGRRNVYCVVDTANEPAPLATYGVSAIMSALIASAAYCQSAIIDCNDERYAPVVRHVGFHLQRCVPSLYGLREDQLPPYFGAKADDALDALKLHAPIIGFHRGKEATPRSSKLDKVLSAGPIDPVDTILPEPANCWTNREVHKGILTQQVASDGRADGPLYHTRRDVVTEAISFEKRIRLQSAMENKSEIVSRAGNAESLIAGWRKVFGTKSPLPLDEALLDEVSEHYLDSWVRSRTYDEIMRKLKDEDPDWDPLYIKDFLKSQVVKKVEKQDGPAKAGQTVTTFPLAKTFTDAFVAAYLERCILRDLPDHIYFHCRKTDEEMDAWVHSVNTTLGDPTKQWYTGVDYTAWDSSVDGGFLGFQFWLARQYGIPEAYLAGLLHQKVNSRTRAGPVGIFQFSGDRFTWLNNTTCNLALTNYAIPIPPGTPQMYSGDDSLIFAKVDFGNHFRASEWRMAPKPVQTQAYGVFCGFEIRKGAAIVNAEALLVRVKIAIANRPNDTELFRSLIDAACGMRASGAFVGENVVLDRIASHVHTCVALESLRDRIILSENRNAHYSEADHEAIAQQGVDEEGIFICPDCAEMDFVHNHNCAELRAHFANEKQRNKRARRRAQEEIDVPDARKRKAKQLSRSARVGGPRSKEGVEAIRRTAEVFDRRAGRHMIA